MTVDSFLSDLFICFGSPNQILLRYTYLRADTISWGTWDNEGKLQPN